VDDELFEAKVINPDTKAWRQTPDLPVEYRKYGEGTKYPVRNVNQIIRIKRVDGTEWLKSRGRIVGLDKAGNEVEHSFTDPELYYKPVTRHEFKRKDPKNEYSPMERKCVEANRDSIKEDQNLLSSFIIGYFHYKLEDNLHKVSA
jgi:hypothetical protein